MSVLRQSSQQVRSRFESIPAQSRVVMLLIAVAIVAGLLMWAQSPGPQLNQPLFGGRSLGDQELDQAEIAFSQAGLNAWERKDGCIWVPTESRHEYLAALKDSKALPVALRSRVQEAINQTNIFESDSVRRARQLHAKAQDLGNQLAAFDDIQWANVVYDQGRSAGLGRAPTQSASVVVCPTSDQPLPASRIRMIQEFIRGSYAGMASDDVVVLDKNADQTVAAITDPSKRRQIEEQSRIEQQVTRLLDRYDGVRVSVSVQMAADEISLQRPTLQTNQATETIVPKESSETSEDGLLSSLLTAVTQVRGNRSSRLPDATQDSSMGSSRLQNTRDSFGDDSRIDNVQVSIGLPEQFFHSAWNRRHGAASKDRNGSAAGTRFPTLPQGLTTLQWEEIKQETQQNLDHAIRPTLLACCPQSVSIEVWAFPDDPETQAATLAATLAAVPSQSPWSSLLTKASDLSPQTIGIAAALALAGVFWIALFLRRRRTDEPIHQVPSVSLQTPGEDPDRDLREQLVTLVDAHPDLAAQIIHSWVGEAA